MAGAIGLAALRADSSFHKWRYDAYALVIKLLRVKNDLLKSIHELI